MEKINYVDSVLKKEITIFCLNKQKSKYLRSIGASKRSLFGFGPEWVICYNNRNELANFFSKLRDADFLFSYDEHGWGPSEVFEDLKEKKL